jgi:hypothetical protein
MPATAAMAVIPILVGSNGELGLSAIQAEVAAALEWRPAVRLVDADPRVEGCGADAVCLAGELEPFGVELAILLVANSDVDPPHLAVRALDVSKRRFVAEELGPVAGSLREALRDRTAKVLDSLGFAKAGRLTVKSDGEISVEPAPIEGSGPRYWVAPGRYRVTVRWGERTAAEEVVVAAGEEREVVLAPIEPPPLVESPWLWIGVAAGAAAIAVAVVLAVRDPGTDVCLGPPGTRCE